MAENNFLATFFTKKIGFATFRAIFFTNSSGRPAAPVKLILVQGCQMVCF
jgi:hypothetical protein